MSWLDEFFDGAGQAPIVTTPGPAPKISITPATESAAGSMSAADKTKLDGISSGSLVTSVTGTAPITSSGGATPAIGISAATDSLPGSMSAADKTKLDGITAGAAVASVSGTAPIVSSGGTTPAISISAATDSTAGSMSAADKTKLDDLPYCVTGASYTQPAPGLTTGSVQVSANTSTTGFQVGQYVYVLSFTGSYVGDYQVSAIADSSHIALLDVNGQGRSATGATIASGATIIPGNPHPRWIPYSTSTTKHAWFVDTTNGTTVLQDLGTAATNMTELGAAAYVLSPGPFGLIPDNRRASQSIGTVSGNAAFTAGGGEAALALPFTLSAWVYVNYDNGGGVSAGAGGHTNGGAFIYRCSTTNDSPSVPSAMLGLNNSIPCAAFLVGTSLVVVTGHEPSFATPTSVTGNTYAWWHLAVTVDGSGNITLYANGVIVATGSLGGSITWNTPSPWVLFGKAGPGDASATTLSSCRMADVRIDTVAQTQAWAQSVYQSRYPGG